MLVSFYTELVELSPDECWTKDIIVTPTLQRGKKIERVASVDNRASNDKNGAPKQWCVSASDFYDRDGCYNFGQSCLKH